jgi:hypothetical protein
MPKTKGGGEARLAVRLPIRIIDEVDRLITKFKALKYNRQQFVESAVREKIEKFWLIEGGLQRGDVQHPSRKLARPHSKTT